MAGRWGGLNNIQLHYAWEKGDKNMHILLNIEYFSIIHMFCGIVDEAVRTRNAVWRRFCWFISHCAWLGKRQPAYFTIQSNHIYKNKLAFLLLIAWVDLPCGYRAVLLPEVLTIGHMLVLDYSETGAVLMGGGHGPSSQRVCSLSSDRQHLSCGVCLEVRGKIIRTVLCCIVYDSCIQS